jgi:site-specific DNA-methyltransferase (adenine-specific)
MADNWQLLRGDCRDTMATLADQSIDAIVTDPPYELGFMGRRWDSSGIAYDSRVWSECLRVLKPGGHMVAFGGTRTYHRLVCAIEDSGFDIRDSIHWLYGSGFPKSHDVSKAIDKAAGAERQVIGAHHRHGGGNPRSVAMAGSLGTQSELPLTAPATDAAREWSGWGTALKPAHEPIVLARKPVDGSIAANVLQHGTGALNIDACRIEGADTTTRHNSSSSSYMSGTIGQVQEIVKPYTTGSELGRWPANLVLTHSADCDDQCAPDCPVALLGEPARFFTVTHWDAFRYVPKASTAERNTGLDDIAPQFAPTMNNGIGGKEHDPETATPKRNYHPTVKPLELMRWLITLITPPNGIVFDPFTGSGSTGVAAIETAHQFIGCEITAEYWPIIEARLAHAASQQPADRQLELF